jgi:hypothetical protein
MDVMYLPSVHGLGDQLNGFTTAAWLANRLERPLRTCFTYDWMITARLPEDQCKNLTRTMNAKPRNRFLMQGERPFADRLRRMRHLRKGRPSLVLHQQGREPTLLSE